MKVKGIVVILISVFIIFFAFWIVFNKDLVSSLLISNKLVPQQETFTELYFENHVGLPTEMEANEFHYFKFAIHNLENKDVDYTYEIDAHTASGSAVFVLKKGTVHIKKDNKKIVTVEFKIPNHFKRAMVEVALLNKKQSIHFWVDEKTQNVTKSL